MGSNPTSSARFQEGVTSSVWRKDMNYELDPRLKDKAERILKTKSDFIGETYWRSGVKRALDILITTLFSTRSAYNQPHGNGRF